MLYWRKKASVCVCVCVLSLTITPDAFQFPNSIWEQHLEVKQGASSVNLRIHHDSIFSSRKKGWKSKDAHSSTMFWGKRSWSTIQTIKTKFTKCCIQIQKRLQLFETSFFHRLLPILWGKERPHLTPWRRRSIWSRPSSAMAGSFGSYGCACPK